jgi:hypothetical protein
MPPGVSPRDIPGNEEPYIAPECDLAAGTMEKVLEHMDQAHEAVLKIMDKLVDERDQLKLSSEFWRDRANHLLNYAQHHPSCSKVAGRLQGIELNCSCGLEESC